MAETGRRSWSLRSFVDSLTFELDQLQDLLAVKGLNRRLTYSVKDLALDLQLFPDFDGEELRFTTARPGEKGAAQISFQLGSITDRQIRETTSEPLTRDDLPIRSVEGMDPKTQRSLEKLGVKSVKDLERVEEENVDLEKMSDQPVDFRKLANMIQRARRQQQPPKVKTVGLSDEASTPSIVVEGERLATAFSAASSGEAPSGETPRFPRAFLGNRELPVLEATEHRVRLGLDAESLSEAEASVPLVVVLDPFAVVRMNLKR